MLFQHNDKHTNKSLLTQEPKKVALRMEFVSGIDTSKHWILWDILLASFSEKGTTITSQVRKQITISTKLDEYEQRILDIFRWSREWKMKLPEMVYGDNCLTVSFDHCSSKLIVEPVFWMIGSFLPCMFFKIAATKTNSILCRSLLIQFTSIAH